MTLLLVDGDCGFCMRAGAWLAVRANGLTVTTLQQVDVTAHHLDAVAVAQRLHAVGPSGVRVGSAAVAEALRHGSRSMRLAAAVIDAPVIRLVAHAVYDLVARFRHRLPGGTTECRLPS